MTLSLKCIILRSKLKLSEQHEKLCYSEYKWFDRDADNFWCLENSIMERLKYELVFLEISNGLCIENSSDIEANNKGILTVTLNSAI
ncbi:869_t:CDS:2 [Entrophospora sp. SA101]|nr:869_t:CDS:2 [Entrophospora sp. SA101]